MHALTQDTISAIRQGRLTQDNLVSLWHNPEVINNKHNLHWTRLIWEHLSQHIKTTLWPSMSVLESSIKGLTQEKKSPTSRMVHAGWKALVQKNVESLSNDQTDLTRPHQIGILWHVLQTLQNETDIQYIQPDITSILHVKQTLGVSLEEASYNMLNPKFHPENNQPVSVSITPSIL